MLDLAIPSNQRYRSKNDNDNKCSNTVSYTHLDVYKRQVVERFRKDREIKINKGRIRIF